MEQQLFLMLTLFTYALTLLSFLLQHNIVVRLFSATGLILCAGIMLADPFYYYGFGSMNIITSVNSRAGDPGRLGEVYTGIFYGFFGGIQLWYAFTNILKYSGEQILKKGKPRMDTWI